MLRLENVVLRLGTFSLSADFSVEAQRSVAIIGPSGAGKSTLLSLIAGFAAPSLGRVLWGQRDLSGLHPSQRPMSILFQDNNLFPHLSIAENVALGLRPSLRLDASETETVRRVLDRVGLTGLGDRKPAALSGGQQSRAALARTLVRRRPLLLLDEPFAALGPALRSEMLDLVADVVTDAGATLLMVTHTPRDAIRLGGDTIFVSDGVAAPPVDSGTLFADPPAALRAYLE